MIDKEWIAVEDMLLQESLCKADLDEHHGVRKEPLYVLADEQSTDDVI
jgi:hypothetical protein